MYSKYMFWRRMPDEKNMLTVLRHQVAQDANLHFYIFFKFKTLQKFFRHDASVRWHTALA